MTYRAGLLTGILATAALGGLVALGWSAFRPTADKPSTKTPPATVLKEDDLLTITLTPEAEKRLQVELGKVQKKLELAPVEQKRMARARTFGGDVVALPGHTILVAAPLNGTLKAPTTGVPRAGSKVKKGDPVFQLLPLLSPDAKATLAVARAEVEGLVNGARVQLTATKINLDRAKDLFNREAGSRQAVDTAQAQYDVAQKALDAAQARFMLLTQAVGDADKGTATPLTLEAPTDGLLRTVSALPEQNVPGGAALFEVVNLDPVWVRVPVFVGEVASLATDTAEIGPLAARSGADVRPARSVSAPPSANALAGTVDLYFMLDNPDAKLFPGQRVGVTLALKESAEDLTVPWSAVVMDINGGTWVYEKLDEHKFARRRVQVRHVKDGVAVLKTGPAAGTAVVTVGAQELFGTEVGNGGK